MIKRVDENGNVRLITNIRKPRKWRRYEYLQGVSGCKIDTEQHGHMNFTYEIKFLAINGVANYVWSVQDGDAYYKLVLSLTYGANSTGRFWMTYWSSSDTNSNIKLTDLDSNIHIAKVSNGYWYWDGVSKGRTVQHSDSFVTTNTINILPDNYNKIYYFKIWDNTDTLLHEYVPAEYNGLYGMWDLVEDKFYPNKGTGTFTVGPEMKNYDEIYEVKKAYSILPSGVELYDYILSSGTLWIDTGAKADLYPFKLDIEFMNHTSSGEKDVWGNINSSLGDKYGFVSGVNALNFFQWGGSSWSKAGATVNQWHVVTYEYPDANNRNMIADGTSYTIAISNNNIILSNSNIYLFSDGPRGSMKFNGKIKYAKIYVGNVLVRNFLPCTYLGEPGMWDTVENKFYRNQGTGLFTLGNKITLKEYEYLLGTGTLWIDTKYTVGPSNAPNIKLYVDVKATSTGVGNKWWVHGIGGGSSVGSLHVGIGNGASGTTNLPFVYGNGRADVTTTVKGDLGTRYKYTLDLKNQTYNITNESGTSLLSLSNIARGTAINTQDMVIYAWRRANTGAIGSSHSDDLYEYKLWDNDILVRHMIPVSYNGTPGLWDKVEWKFYANAGSGSFTLGPEKASGTYPVSYLYDRTVYEEPDGSKWLRIAHHNGPNTRRFTSSDSFTTYIHTSNDLFFDVSWCNTFTLWELMVKLKTTSGATELKFRWILNYNPMTATFDNTKKANVTHNTSSGYTAPSGNWGGLMKINSNNTYLCGNNGTNGNWWGAIGCKILYSGGLPGWNSLMVTTGHLDLYIRIA